MWFTDQEIRLQCAKPLIYSACHFCTNVLVTNWAQFKVFVLFLILIDQNWICFPSFTARVHPNSKRWICIMYISHLYMKLLCSIETKYEIFSNFCGILRIYELYVNTHPKEPYYNTRKIMKWIEVTVLYKELYQLL